MQLVKWIFATAVSYRNTAYIVNLVELWQMNTLYFPLSGSLYKQRLMTSSMLQSLP